MRAWFATLHNICERELLEEIPFDLANKPAHAFVHNALQLAERSRLLASHYDILLSVLGGEQLNDLIVGWDLVLAVFAGRSGRRYELRLERSPSWCAEGELRCRLVVQNDRITVATISFAVGADRQDGSKRLWIGGLQGSEKQYGKLFTIQVTKDLFGLRPKDLLIQVVYALKENFGASEIIAASNLGHVNRDVRGEKQWAADYDHYWTELGGRADGPYTFKLPSHLRKRTVDEVAPGKRSAWRARHTLINKIREDVAEFQARSCDL